MYWVNIGSGNGLSPVRRQAITRTNVDLLSIGPSGNKFQWNLIQNARLFIQENALKHRVRNGGNFVQAEMIPYELWAPILHQPPLSILSIRTIIPPFPPPPSNASSDTATLRLPSCYCMRLDLCIKQLRSIQESGCCTHSVLNQLLLHCSVLNQILLLYVSGINYIMINHDAFEKLIPILLVRTDN